MVARVAGTGSPRLARAALLLATLAIGALALAARADAYIYFGNYGTGSVGRFNQNDPSDGRFDFIPNGNSGVAVDSTYIYWTNLEDFTIGRATLDATNVNPNFIPQAGLPAAVAVNDRFIYWTNQIVPQAIGRARINGDPSSVNQSFISVPSTNIEGIAVDDKHIYWTQEGTPTTPAAIGRANLGGKAVDPNFITGSGRDGPYNGVAVDSKYVYWSNGSDVSGPGAISRANLDGSGVELGFITPARDPIGVAVDATHIYWSNSPEDPDGTLRPALGRANLDGTQADPLWFEYGLGSEFCCATQLAINALPASCAGSDATIAGTRQADRLRGTKDDDVIAAGKGGDTVVGLEGDDLVCGARGDDVLRGKGGDDDLRGGAGDDDLRGGGGSNRCRGGAGSDTKQGC